MIGPSSEAAARGEFPIFEHTTYLNSCSQGALSHRVRAAYEEYLAGWDANGAEWEFWVERAETAARASRGCCTGAGRGRRHDLGLAGRERDRLGAAARARRAEPIVISEYEFPTVGQIAHAQELRGAEVVHVLPDADGSIPVERFAEAIDERTALVCCTTISYRTGHRNDVAAIAEVAHARGALVLADSYQAAGAIELDVRRSVRTSSPAAPSSTCSPRPGSASCGCAAACSRGCCRRRRGGSPTRTSSGWTSRTTRRTRPRAASTRARRRCRTSTRASPGCRLIEETGVPAIEEHVRGLNTRLIDGLDELGATVVTPSDPAHRGPLVCVRSTDAPALVASLAEERINVLLRDDNLRVAPHLYNTDDDIDTLLGRSARRAPSSPKSLCKSAQREAGCPPDDRLGNHPDQVANLHLPRATAALAGCRPRPRRLLAVGLGSHADDTARARPRGARDRRLERRVPAGRPGRRGWPGTLEDVAAAAEPCAASRRRPGARRHGRALGRRASGTLARRPGIASAATCPGRDRGCVPSQPSLRRVSPISAVGRRTTSAAGRARGCSEASRMMCPIGTPSRLRRPSFRSECPSSSSTVRGTTSCPEQSQAYACAARATKVDLVEFPEADHFDLVEVVSAAGPM